MISSVAWIEKKNSFLRISYIELMVLYTLSTNWSNLLDLHEIHLLPATKKMRTIYTRIYKFFRKQFTCCFSLIHVFSANDQ